MLSIEFKIIYMEEIIHIQTEVDRDLHAKLLSMSRHTGRKLKEIVREALEEYVKKFEEEVEKDPIFDVIGSFETKEGDWSERDRWRE